MDDGVVAAVLEDVRSAPIPEPLRAALLLLQAVNERPVEVPRAELAACEAAGSSVEAIEDIAAVGFHFELINRIADAFDFPIPDARQQARQTRLLDLRVPSFGGARPEPSWVQGEGGELRPVEVEDGRTHMLTTPGFTEPGLRRAVEAHVVRARGGVREGPEVPAPWRPYLDKLARHAYRIVDEDVDALREAGHDEDQILELTIVGSMAAASVALESIVAGLHGRANAIPTAAQ